MAPKTDRQLLQETHDTVTEIAVMAKAHNRTLYGNGQPGLVKEFSEVRVAQAECPARSNAKRGNSMFVVALVAVIVSAVGVLWMIGVAIAK